MGNLAYNTNATANTYVMPYSPLRAVDGSTSPFSRWLCNTLPGWIQVDLQGANIYSVNRWVIRHMPVAGWKAPDYVNSDFRLQGSYDAKYWIDIDAVIGNTASITDRTYATPTSFRYYRVYFTKGLNTNPQLASIYEFELYQFFSAKLSNLTISSGTLTPAFSSDTLAYTAIVSADTSSINVVPTAQSVSATITVNGTMVASGSAIPVNLACGNNTISVIVYDNFGAMKQTYTITVTRPGSNYLSNLTAAQTNGTNIALSPTPFVKTTIGYTASVGFDVDHVTVTPTAENSASTITVNGIAVASGSASGPISLNTGINNITVVVSANGTSLSYTIAVTRANSAYLSNLTAQEGVANIPLTPSFNKTTLGYNASVTYSTSSITITPTAESSSAIITVNGTTVTSGQASGLISLNVGTNSIPVVVTTGGIAQTYSVVVTRTGSDYLSNLTAAKTDATNIPLNRPFTRTTDDYTASVDYSVSSMTVTPTAEDSTAIITINGTPVISGQASGPIALNTGINNITIVVSANGTSQSYTIAVTRANSAYLSNLTAAKTDGANIALSPTPFVKTTMGYTTSVGFDVDHITVKPTAEDSTSTITVNGTAVASGSASGPISLKIGTNTIPVIVIAGGITQTYSIVVTRADSAFLSDLTTQSGSAGLPLSPTFTSNTLSYTTHIGGKTSVTVTPTALSSNASITVNGTPVTSGQPSGSISVKNGTVITIVVTCDGLSSTYTVTIKKP